MLDGLRGPQAELGASYAAVWANLRQQYPSLRTILITGASIRDNASVAAVGLAVAAVRLERSSVLVMVLDSAKQDHRVLDSPDSSVRIIAASSPAKVRAALSDKKEEFAFAIVVAPAPQKGPDCISLASAADVAILVARSGQTRFREAQLAANLLRQAGLATAAALLLIGGPLRRRESVDAEARRTEWGGPRGNRRERPART